MLWTRRLLLIATCLLLASGARGSQQASNCEQGGQCQAGGSVKREASANSEEEEAPCILTEEQVEGLDFTKVLKECGE